VASSGTALALVTFTFSQYVRRHGSDITQAVSRRLLTGEARVGFVVGNIVLGKVFLREVRSAPVNIISLMHRTHSCVI
jgi:sugar/nucleoside kinase (ribokinase family)